MFRFWRRKGYRPSRKGRRRLKRLYVMQMQQRGREGPVETYDYLLEEYKSERKH